MLVSMFVSVGAGYVQFLHPPSAEMTPGILPGLTMPGRKGSLLPHSGHRDDKSPQNHSPATELLMSAVFG